VEESDHRFNLGRDRLEALANRVDQDPVEMVRGESIDQVGR
jgi:hypothetical protein